MAGKQKQKSFVQGIYFRQGLFFTRPLIMFQDVQQKGNLTWEKEEHTSKITLTESYCFF